MSIEIFENCYNNNLNEKMSVKKLLTESQETVDGDKNNVIKGNYIKTEGGHKYDSDLAKSPIIKENVEGKMRLISSSDSGQGTANEHVCSDDKSFQSDGHINGEHMDSPSERSRSNSSDGMRVEEKLLAADSKFNQDDVSALLECEDVKKHAHSQASESENQSRTVSWVNTCNDDGKNFYNHLDVKKYYSVTRGETFMNEIYEKINKRDRYTRRVNYDPDQPAAGTENDMEYKFYLDKMGVKKLIGFQGENSETIRAVNQVDFYVSKDQEDNDTEIVTIRGSWENVRRTVNDIKNMMNSVGKEICVSHINTAVNPSEFVLQNLYTQYLRIRLNNLECVSVVGAMGTTVMMQNTSDYRYHKLAQLDSAINTVYGVKDGWKRYFNMPPERVPLPINDFSVVVAPDARGTYYRAIVESSNLESGEVQVWFLDWGGRTVVPVDKIYKLHNSFNELPYVGLVGNLAGCQLSDPEENESFGRFLFQFLRRHMPIKVKAVNMDAYGYYTVLLYGNGGECINHLLIDNKWVNSVPYCTYHPFVDEIYVPAQYYDPEAKEILEFKFKAYEPFPGYYPADFPSPDSPEDDENHQYPDSENVPEHGSRAKHRVNFNLHGHGGQRKYRYKSERHFHQNNESDDGPRRYKHEKRRPTGFKPEPQKSEVSDKPKLQTQRTSGKVEDKPTNHIPVDGKENISQKPHAKASVSRPEAPVPPSKQNVNTNASVNAKSVHVSNTKLKPKPPPVSKTKADSNVAKNSNNPCESTLSEATQTPEVQSKPATQSSEQKLENDSAPNVPGTSCPTKVTPLPDNPWSSIRVSKSNIFSPKSSNEKTQSTKCTPCNNSSPQSPVSCDSSAVSSCSTSKSQEKLSDKADTSSQLVSSRTCPSLESEETLPDHWTVVSKRRSRRKGKY